MTKTNGFEMINSMLALIPDASEFENKTKSFKKELDTILTACEIREPMSLKTLDSKLKFIKEDLKSKNYSYDQLLDLCASLTSWNEIVEFENEGLKKLNDGLSTLVQFTSKALKNSQKNGEYLSILGEVGKAMALIEGQLSGRNAEKRLAITRKAKFAANKKHEATNKAKEEIKQIWASGKYTSRDVCAEQECAVLNLSFSTARKALRGTPEPTQNT